jgi:hypothetical protein
MLRTNLATRPFYNERAVLGAIGLVAFLTAALAAFNAAQIFSLTSRNSEFVARAEASEAKAAEYRDLARKTQQALDREEVDAVQEAAREANQLIDRRAFSWTLLFNQFEETLPSDVRILGVAPQVDREGRMLVAVTVIARGDEDIDAFIDRLRSTGAFSQFIARQDETQEDGTIRAVLQGYYAPVIPPVKAASSPPASDSGRAAGPGSGQAGNESPENATPEDATPDAAAPGSKPKPLPKNGRGRQ